MALPARLNKLAVAKMIDHSLLQPQMTQEDIRRGCEVAAKYNCASVCVHPSNVCLCVEALRGTEVKISTVIGFPHGTVTTDTKVFEAKKAVADGAVELDMVLNIGWLRSGLVAEVTEDIRAVVDAVKGHAIVKVILENAYLSNEQKVAGCRAAEAAGAHFVKTSTGYASSGSTPEDLRLMRATVSPSVAVKAAGGIRTLDALLLAAACGATRCGATATAIILDEYDKRDPTGEGLPLPDPAASVVAPAAAATAY